MKRLLIRPAKRQQSGFTLIELMISMIVLVVGLLALIGLLAVAIESNGRNKVDSTATMLAQSVLEQINSTMLEPVPGNASITDCAANNFAIDVGATGGAALSTSSGNIDFSQAASSVPSGYQMDYVVCADDPNSGGVIHTTYDVRWNVKPVTAGTYLITVGAVSKRTSSINKNPRAFAFPSNLRLMIGPETQ